MSAKSKTKRHILARRVVFITVMCAFVATPVLADFYGGRVYWERIDSPFKYYSGGGGEFTLRSDGGPGLLLSNSAYADTTRDQGGYAGSFQTFCIELGEYLKQPMDIVVSESWAPDGTPLIPQWGSSLVTPASHAILGGEPSLGGDDLNPQTAYLYYQFAKGILSNYEYLNAGVGRSVSAGNLQDALWYLEGEIGTVTGQAETWVKEAVDATGLAFDIYTDINPLDNPWGATIGDVRVLNTWVIDKVGNLYYKKQDQLYLTPVPGAVLLGMLGLGVAGIKLRKFS